MLRHPIPLISCHYLRTNSLTDLYEPSFTRRIAAEKLALLDLQHLIYGSSIAEDRASKVGRAFESANAVQMHCVESVDDAICRFESLSLNVNLFEESDLASLISRLSGPVGVDITSLEHHIWAPLVKALVASEKEFLVLYAEPVEYQASDEIPGSDYDLSSGLGIEPLPGFAKISRRSDEEGYFAPLLGFEGARLAHIFDQESVEAANTSPIIGVPGFRLEYSAYSYLANERTLAKGYMHRRVEFARANCPFEAFRALERVHSRARNKHLRVAPIGTKPHALGAILYAIKHPDLVEIIYDNPVRTPGRTSGIRMVNCYEVSGFLEWLDRT